MILIGHGNHFTSCKPRERLFKNKNSNLTVKLTEKDMVNLIRHQLFLCPNTLEAYNLHHSLKKMNAQAGLLATNMFRKQTTSALTLNTAIDMSPTWAVVFRGKNLLCIVFNSSFNSPKVLLTLYLLIFAAEEPLLDLNLHHQYYQLDDVHCSSSLS